MTDAPDEQSAERADDDSATDAPDDDLSAADAPSDDSPDADREDGAESVEQLRREVEEKYDFEDFGPSDMAEMSVTEWEAAFDPETWTTGEALLDRVEAELRSNVHRREVFAVVERVGEGDDDRLVAYSDEGYVIVRPDGSILGTGTILRDVEPMVALCAMESYEVPDPPTDAGLPHPDTVPQGSGDFGNRMLQLVAGGMLLAGLSLLAVWLASLPGLVDLGTAGAIVAAIGLGFLLIGAFLFVTVANARLSDRMRSTQYRDRLRAIGAGREGRPAFLPDDAFEAGGRELEQAMDRLHRDALESGDESDR